MDGHCVKITCTASLIGSRVQSWAHDTCIKPATSVYYKRELPRTWTQNVPTAQKMHVFVLWQLLRDETNFCWERCPCHTTHRIAPHLGQNDINPRSLGRLACPSPPTPPPPQPTPPPLYQCFAQVLLLTSIPWLPQALSMTHVSPASQWTRFDGPS